RPARRGQIAVAYRLRLEHPVVQRLQQRPGGAVGATRPERGQARLGEQCLDGGRVRGEVKGGHCADPGRDWRGGKPWAKVPRPPPPRQENGPPREANVCALAGVVGAAAAAEGRLPPRAGPCYKAVGG